MKESDLQTVPCKFCGTPTSMTATKRCTSCWELESRIIVSPFIAEKIFKDIDKRRSDVKAAVADLKSAGTSSREGSIPSSGTRVMFNIQYKATAEFVVRVYVNGKYNEGRTYYTPYQDDAISTMFAMVKEEWSRDRNREIKVE